MGCSHSSLSRNDGRQNDPGSLHRETLQPRPTPVAPSASATNNSTVITPGESRITLSEQQRQLLALPREQLAHVPRAQLDQFRDAFESLSLDDLHRNYARPGRRTIPPHKNEAFVYQPLPTPTSIRLLSLLPEDENGMIRCTLTAVDLKQSPVPRYHCLSYTWGNPLPRGTGFPDYDEAERSGEFSVHNRHPISCNGRVLHICKNLYDAFKQLPVFPDIYVADGRLQTDLHISAEQGRTAFVFSNLMDGAPPNLMDASGKTPLHHAAANGHFDSADILLKSGADPKRVDYSNKTPVEYARENGYPKITELILNFTADKRITLPSNSQRRNNPVPVYLWVDAICINQGDLREKASQVNMMDQIYKSAETTIMWLGREDHHTKTAIQTILKLYPFLDKLRDSGITPYRALRAEEYKMRGLPHISEKEWDALASIYLRQWFQRVWVLQELVLAKAVVSFCGPQELPWHFVELTRVLGEIERKAAYAGSIKYIPNDRAAYSIGMNFEHMLNCRERRLLDEATLEVRKASAIYRGPDKRCQFPLPRLVLSFWTLSSTDPRDKVFALLGITRGDPDSPSILADYTAPVKQVYAEITKRMILQPQDTDRPLHILSCILHNNQMETLPSWVPDYSVPGSQPLSVPGFFAAGSLSSSVSWGSTAVSWNRLGLRGFHVGTITGASKKRELIDRATKYGFDPTWFELIYTVPTPYPTGQPLSEVLWRTLCADKDSVDRTPAPMHLGDQFRDFVSAQMLADADSAIYAVMQSLSAADSQLLASGAVSLGNVEIPYPSWVEDMVASERNSFIPSIAYVRDYANNPKYRIWDPERQVFIAPPPEQAEYFHTFGKVYGTRRLFKTGGGTAGGKVFLGIGPGGLENGDEVWVFPGSKVPFILRGVGNGEYRLVGDGYVHGMMQGEGIQGKSLREVILT